MRGLPPSTRYPVLSLFLFFFLSLLFFRFFLPAARWSGKACQQCRFLVAPAANKGSNPPFNVVQSSVIPGFFLRFLSSPPG